MEGFRERKTAKKASFPLGLNEKYFGVESPVMWKKLMQYFAAIQFGLFSIYILTAHNLTGERLTNSLCAWAIKKGVFCFLVLLLFFVCID